MTLVKEKVTVLGDVLSKAPHILKNDSQLPGISKAQVLELGLATEMADNYATDQILGHMFKLTIGIVSQDYIQRQWLYHLLP